MTDHPSLNNGAGQAGLRLGVVSFTFSRQAYDRIPALGPIGRDAPCIHPDTQTRRRATREARA